MAAFEDHQAHYLEISAHIQARIYTFTHRTIFRIHCEHGTQLISPSG